VPLQNVPYPYPLSTVFPQDVPASISSRTPSLRGLSVMPNGSPIQPPIHAFNGESPGGVGAAKDLTQDVEQGKTTWEGTMGLLKIMEYRYTRFALEPGTGKWAMIR
jgi:cation-transporting ATPase 13A2